MFTQDFPTKKMISIVTKCKFNLHQATLRWSEWCCNISNMVNSTKWWANRGIRVWRSSSRHMEVEAIMVKRLVSFSTRVSGWRIMNIIRMNSSRRQIISKIRKKKKKNKCRMSHLMMNLPLAKKVLAMVKIVISGRKMITMILNKSITDEYF